MTPEEIEAKKALKKQKQHEAYRKWYVSPKGQAYLLKRKMKEAGVPEPVES